jgi:hypothetical protein
MIAAWFDESIGIEASMTTKTRTLLAAVTLLGFAAVVVSLKVIGGPRHQVLSRPAPPR